MTRTPVDPRLVLIHRRADRPSRTFTIRRPGAFAALVLAMLTLFSGVTALVFLVDRSPSSLSRRWFGARGPSAQSHRD